MIDGQLTLGRHVLGLQFGILRNRGAATARHRGHVGLWLDRGVHPRQIIVAHRCTSLHHPPYTIHILHDIVHILHGTGHAAARLQLQ